MMLNKARIIPLAILVILLLNLVSPLSSTVYMGEDETLELIHENSVTIHENEVLIWSYISVSSGNTLILKNTTIYLKRDPLIGIPFVMVSGNLTMINSTITAYNESEPYYVEVKSGGILILKNNSVISAARSDLPYLFSPIKIDANAYFYMNNSILRDIRSYNFASSAIVLNANNITLENSIFQGIYDDVYGGVVIKGKNITITNCSFIGNTVGISLKSNSNQNVTIDNSSFLNNTYALYIDKADNITVKNSRFIGNYYDMMIYSSNITVINNTIYGPSYGISISEGLNLTFHDNNFFNSCVWLSGTSEQFKNLILDNSNIVNNYPILYYFNVSDLTLENKTIGALILVDSTNISVNNARINTLEILWSDAIDFFNITSRSGSFGISLYHSENITITDYELSYHHLPISDSVASLSYIAMLSYSENVTINNLDFHDSTYGIVLDHSTNITITNSKIYRILNSSGIKLSQVDFSSITDCNVTEVNENGIYLHGVENISVINNRIISPAEYGISVSGYNITLSGNSLENCSFFFEDSMNSEKYKTLVFDSSNTVNGKPILYIFNQTNTIVLKDNNAYGQIIIAYSSNLTADNIVSTLFLHHIDYVTITNSTFSDLENGIYSEKCPVVNVSWSRFSNNRLHGMYLNTLNSSIFYNNFTNNNIGIYAKVYLIHANTSIYLNNFINNTISAKSEPYCITWYYNHLGNYWSDYNGTDKNLDGIGDEPYTFSDNMDEYPLLNPIHISEPIGYGQIVVSSISNSISQEFGGTLVIRLKIISDLSLIRYIILRYYKDNIPGYTFMSYDGIDKSYYCYIPAQAVGTSLTYHFEFNRNGTIYYSKNYTYTFTSDAYTTPNIVNVSYPPSVIFTESILITANITDTFNISKVLIYHLVDSGWIGEEMTLDPYDNLYKYVFTNLTPGTFSFFIYAENEFGNSNKTQIYNITIIYQDIIPPTILSVSWTPNQPYEYENITVYVSATDNEGINQVIISWKINDTWYNKTANLNGSDLYSVHLQGLPAEQSLMIKAYVEDVNNNWAVSGIYLVSFVKNETGQLPTNETTPTNIFSGSLLPQAIIVIILSFIFGIVVGAIIIVKKRKK